ncbi:MAG: hypothetical protein ACKOYM_00035 [Actinomycetes bacterium]
MTAGDTDGGVDELWSAVAVTDSSVDAAVASLEAIGYRALVDRAIPADQRPIDLLLVGTGGVCVIAVRRVDAGDGAGLGSLRSSADTVLGVCAAVVELLHRRGVGTVSVFPMVCIDEDTNLGGLTALDGVTLTTAAGLVSVVGSLPASVPAGWVSGVADFLDESLPVRIIPSVETVPPPDEPVVFLTPWFREGQRRLYVRDEEGNGGGYLDLVSGRVVGTSDDASSVLTQLLPVFGASDASGTTADDRSVVRKFLSGRGPRPVAAASIPMVVGQVREADGARRLHVHRVDADGTATELGAFDLIAGSVQVTATSDARAESTVRYCGHCYLRAVASKYVA